MIEFSIVKDGKLVFAEGFGSTDTAGTSVTNTTVFGIGPPTLSARDVLTRTSPGSCTKAFTSTLVSMLVDQGFLDFDEPVTSCASLLVLRRAHLLQLSVWVEAQGPGGHR